MATLLLMQPSWLSLLQGSVASSCSTPSPSLQSRSSPSLWVVPPQEQGFPFLVELHEVLQPIEVPVDDSTTIGCGSRSSLSCISCRLTADALCPITQVIDKDVKQYSPR